MKSFRITDIKPIVPGGRNMITVSPKIMRLLVS